MKSYPQTPCFEAELGKFGGELKEFIPPGCQSSACTCSAWEAGWAGGRGGTREAGSEAPSPAVPAETQLGTAKGQAVQGEGSCSVRGAKPGCRAGCVHPPDSQLRRQLLLSLLPRRRVGGWKERVKAGAAEQPSTSMYVAAEASVPNQIIIKPNQNNANTQHRLVLQKRCLFLLISSVKPVTLGREAQ